MPAPIPAILAPYLRDCLADSSQVTVTSTIDASSSWLLLRCLGAALHGITDEIGASRRTPSDIRADNPTKVVLLSIIRPFELWSEMAKKIGLDFTSSIKNKQIAYIDGVVAETVNAKQTANVTRARSLRLEDLGRAIHAAKQDLAATAGDSARYVMIIDGIDFALASRPDMTYLQLSQFLTSIREQFSNVILFMAADAQLIHNVDASATPLEVDHGMLVRTIAYQSSWVFQLRPLETGSARDVSGVLRISHGGSAEADQSKLPDGEWLYQVRSDGNVRVWGRGE